MIRKRDEIEEMYATPQIKLDSRCVDDRISKRSNEIRFLLG